MNSWIVIHTKSRQEKAVAAAIDAMGYEYFLPLICGKRYHGKRKVDVELPLFSGYLFFRGTNEQAYEVDRTGRVVQIIQVADQGQIEWELANIRMAVEEGGLLDPYRYLEKGVRVEVTGGPFHGLQGVVEDRLKADRLVLQIDTLGRAVSMEVDGSLLQVVE